jgi:hypothetical protein
VQSLHEGLEGALVAELSRTPQIAARVSAVMPVRCSKCRLLLPCISCRQYAARNVICIQVRSSFRAHQEVGCHEGAVGVAAHSNARCVHHPSPIHLLHRVEGE